MHGITSYRNTSKHGADLGLLFFALCFVTYLSHDAYPGALSTVLLYINEMFCLHFGYSDLQATILQITVNQFSGSLLGSKKISNFITHSKISV